MHAILMATLSSRGNKNLGSRTVEWPQLTQLQKKMREAKAKTDKEREMKREESMATDGDGVSHTSTVQRAVSEQMIFAW